MDLLGDWIDENSDIDVLFDQLNIQGGDINDKNKVEDVSLKVDGGKVSTSSILESLLSSSNNEIVEEDDDVMEEIRKQLTSDFDTKNTEVLVKLISRLKRGQYTNIVILCGAGISTSAGIPDFRSPKSGLYANLEEYNLPYPEAIFELDFYNENPKPFTLLAKEMFLGAYKHTKSHDFIKLLDGKNYLLRLYTQNIDDLEYSAGITESRMIQAHGTFRQAHCVSCSKEFDIEKYKLNISQEIISKCECSGLVKPDIVFFGESLPADFHKYSRIDFKQCDLMIVMGTSLTVHPVAGLINYAPKIPRLLLNRELCGKFDFSGIDCAILGDLDDICNKLSALIS